MGSRDFYAETKWCDECKGYVRYLMSVDYSYCVHCGTKVRLFSKEDAERFAAALDRRRWKVS